MNILAIETSCDETAISLLEGIQTPVGINFIVHANITHSQIDVHREFGGVFPALAKREHQRNLVPILLKILGIEITNTETILPESISELLIKEPELRVQFKNLASLPKPDIDYICVTSGPGLEPALWVGINFAKALGQLWNIHVVPVNHMEGHILSVLVPETNNNHFTIPYDILPFPALALLISGGHTELVLVKDIGEYKIIGQTRDDAVGEAFDKTARVLGLPYPGGPEIAKLAALYSPSPSLGEGRDEVVFPRPMIKTNDYDFSFSGLKTSVLYYAQSLSEITESDKIAISYEFQEAVTEVLVAKTKKAISEFEIKTLIIGGGVAANTRIIQGMKDMITNFPEVTLLTPARELSTDNSLMIGLAGYFKIQKNPDTQYPDIIAEGNLGL